MGRFRHKSALVILAVALAGAAAFAVVAIGIGKAQTIKVDVKLVRLLVSVKDAQGELVGSLEKPDFSVYDSGVKQDIAIFEHHTEVPLSVSLLIDTSGSTSSNLRYEITSVQKFLHRRNFVAQIAGGRSAGVDQQGHGKRDLSMVLENGDVLLDAAIVDTEIGLLERSNQFALRILDRHQQPDQLDVDLDRLGLPNADRDHGEGGGASESDCQDYERAFVTESSHSPSTHTSPSAKYSFFQIGTRRFRRLMPSSAASNAALRWGEAATTTTLASPISIRPRRWMMPIRPMSCA